MAQIRTIIKKSLIPMIGINAVVLTAAGIWLLDKGIWVPLWPTVLAMILAPFVFPLLLLPAAFFSGVMQVSEQSHPRVSKIMMLAALGYTAAMLSGYATGFLALIKSALEDSGLMVPGLMWAISSAVLPWLIFSLRDRDNVFFISCLLMLQAAVVPVAFLATQASVRTGDIFWSLAALLVLQLLLQALYDKIFFKAPPASK